MLEHLSVGASISIHDRELVGASMVGAMQKLAIVCYSIKFHQARNVAYFLTQDSRTALMLAAVGGRSEMVKLLLHRHKATVDERSSTLV